jgi:predicted nucleic acid-binding protein
MRVVLGADVLIGALDSNDPHHSRARTLFRSWQRRDASLFVSIVNLTEVWSRPRPSDSDCGLRARRSPPSAPADRGSRRDRAA